LLDQALQLDPRNEAAKVDKLELLVRLKRIDEAKTVLDALHPLTADDARVAPLRAQISFAAEGSEDANVLAARIAQHPDDLASRLEMARHHVRARAYEAALEQLLEIIRRDRKFGNDAGRRTMLEIFDLLGPDDERVAAYRRKLASALY
jgi:putative thioredoxin